MTLKSQKPAIAITMGDPCGIGPEVVVKALADPRVYDSCRPMVIGNTYAMNQAVKATGLPLAIRETDDPTGAGEDPATVDVVDIHNLNPEDITVGQLSVPCGKAAMEWVTKAGELALAGIVDGIATAPLNKEAAAMAGYESIGHTELLQELSGARIVPTMLMSKNLRVVHLTTHRSLRVACDYVKKDRILDFLQLTHDSASSSGAFPTPASRRPDSTPTTATADCWATKKPTKFAPAVAAARERGIDAVGPIPADSVFHQAISGRYDAVLAMFHDQGHIPVKVYGFEESVTANLGLPFVRTSVDHGTAFDIAGQGIAQHVSMLESIRLAVELARGNGLADF